MLTGNQDRRPFLPLETLQTYAGRVDDTLWWRMVTARNLADTAVMCATYVA